MHTASVLRPRMPLVIRRMSAVIVAMILALVVVEIASAHVTVNPNVVIPGSFSTFNVRVPTEKDEPTVKVRIEFPADLLVSRFKPKEGWQRAVEKDSTGRIIAATWSGGEIASDEYDEFTFLARVPNQPGTLTFKAFQTYQSGDTVNWVEGPDGDNPAPVVTVSEDTTASGASSHVGSPAAGATATADTVTTATVAATSSAVETEASSAPVMATMDVPAPGTAAGSSDSPSNAANVSVTPNNATVSGGSDLPLFISLGALVLALIALAVGVIAITRRGGRAA